LNQLNNKACSAVKPAKLLRHLSLAAGLLAFILTFATIEDLGITADEPGYYESCLQQIEWLKLAGRAFASGNWKEPFSQQVTDRYWNYQPQFNVHPHFYKLCSSATLILFQGWLGPVAAYRLSPAVIFSILVGLLFWSTGRRYGTAAGVWAAASFLLMPRLFGHAHIGATDIPITMLWFASAISFYRALESRGWAVVFALVYGLALATKFTAFVIPVPLVLFVLLSRKFKQAAWPVGLALVLSPLIMVGLNPHWWHHTIERVHTFILNSSTRAQYMQGTAFIYYLGGKYTFNLPWHHCLVYTAFTVPPVALAGFLIGFFKTVRRPLADPWAAHLLLHWLVLMGVMMLPGTPSHDGVRMFMPSFPFIAVISAKGFHHFVPHARKVLGRSFKSLTARTHSFAPAALLCLLLIPAAMVLVRLHPYELCYYNILAGGMPGARSLGMETTYWWDPVNKPFCELINARLPDSAVVSTRNNNHFRFLQKLGMIKPGLRFESDNIDYRLVYYRQGIFRDLDWLMSQRGRPMLEISKNGIPLLAVYAFRDFLNETLSEISRRLLLPNPPAKLHYDAALIYQSLHKNDLMIQELKQYSQLEPRDFKANLLLASELLKQNMPKEAIKRLRQISGNIEDHAIWNFGMAEACYLLGDYDRCMYYLNQVLKKQSLNPRSHFNLGFIYYSQKKDLEKAIKHLELALRIEPENTNYLNYIATICRTENKNDKARYYYERLLGINPKHVSALKNMGTLLIIQGDTSGAENYYHQALAIDSTESTSNNNLGKLYLETGRKDRAEKHFKILVGVNPEDFQSHLALGLIYMDYPERWSEALEEFRTAARLSPEKAKQLEREYIIPLQNRLAARTAGH